MIGSPLQPTSKKGKPFEEKDLEVMHHQFMKIYGWIPFDEFKNIPLATLFTLHKMVFEEINKQEELRIILLKFCGVKNPT